MKQFLLLVFFIFFNILTIDISMCQTRLRSFFENKKYGFIDETGKILIKPSFDYVGEQFKDGLTLFIKGDTNGYIDNTGKIVFISKYAKYPFNEGLAPFFKEGKLGFFKKNGQVAFYPSFKNFILGSELVQQGIPFFSEGVASLLIKNCDTCSWYNSIFVNKQGKSKFGGKTFAIANNFSCGLAYVRENNGRNGYINHKGNFVILLANDEYGERFSEGFAVVTDSLNNCYYIDKEGKKLSNLTFENAVAFSDGMAKVKINGKWGFINTAGNLIINSIYNENTCSFTEGVASVTVNGSHSEGEYHSLSFFIDKKGEVVLGPFEDVILQEFYNGLSLEIKRSTENDISCTVYSYINKLGKVVFKVNDCANYSP